MSPSVRRRLFGLLIMPCAPQLTYFTTMCNAKKTMHGDASWVDVDDALYDKEKHPFKTAHATQTVAKHLAKGDSKVSFRRFIVCQNRSEIGVKF